MNRFKIVITMMVTTLFLIANTVISFAESNWAKDHPRRVHVNKRLKRQHKRINREVREGEITKAQAAKLHRRDRMIRHEERAMARQNAGHITRQEQKVLNQQENAASREIGK